MLAQYNEKNYDGSKREMNSKQRKHQEELPKSRCTEFLIIRT